VEAAPGELRMLCHVGKVPRFHIKELPSNYYGMVGRGTSVFSVQEVKYR